MLARTEGVFRAVLRLLLPSWCLFSDIEYSREVIQNGRDGPLKPGETWTDVLPPLIGGTIFLSIHGLHMGASRSKTVFAPLGADNRTHW